MSEHHIVSIKTYAQVLGVLFVLTMITVLVARPVTGVDFGFLNTAIAMLIASVKAVLVLGIFMHLKYDDKIYWVILGSSVFFLILLYFLSVVDFYTRVPEANVL